jgi:hypothetical protein
MATIFGKMPAPPKNKFSALLAGGDSRSIGKANAAASMVIADPERIPALVECLVDPDPLVRMRAADAIEKFSRQYCGLLQPFKTLFIELLAETRQKEVRWHLALIVPRLRLNAPESQLIAETLQGFLSDSSSIVKTCAMQGLTELIAQRPSLRPSIVNLVRQLTKTGTPAMRARGRILLSTLEPNEF